METFWTAALALLSHPFPAACLLGALAAAGVVGWIEWRRP